MNRLLILAALTLSVSAAAAAPSAAAKDPLLLFHASFDKDIDKADTAIGSPDAVPFIYDRSWLLKEKNIADWQCSKDAKAYRAAQAPDGVKGPCLKVDIGQSHRFRALGNVSPRAGAISFWVRFDRALSDAHSPILNITGSPFGFRVRSHSVGVSTPLGETRPMSGQFKPGVWYHFALVYDCRQGFKTYINGKLDPTSRWGKPACGWQTDALFLDLIALAADWYSGSPSPMSLDEVMIFSQPLAAAEVARLASRQPLSAQPAIEPPAADEVAAAHRRAELGWDLPGDFPACVLGGAPLRLRILDVLASRDVRAWRTGAVDGVPATRWPSSYQGYEVPVKGLHLELEPGARVDAVTLRGNFDGRLYASDGIGEPPHDTALAALKSPGKFLRANLPKPAQTARLSFFRAATRNREADKDGRVFKEGETSIYDMTLWRIDTQPVDIEKAPAQTLHFSTQPAEIKDQWIRWALDSHFEPADRAALALQPGAGQDALLPALRHTHVFAPAAKQDTPLAGLRLVLDTANAQVPMRLRLQVHHPVDITRALVFLDLDLKPGASGRAEVVVGLPGFIIPPGQPLWLTLTPEKDLPLLASSRLDLLLAPMDKARETHVRATLGFAKDRFIHVSEPRPWGRIPMERCALCLLGFRQLHFALLDLQRLAPANPQFRGIWAWTHPHENPDLGQLAQPQAYGAPDWAVYAKESMKLFRAFALWWIENRQIPNGLFGSGYGDDSDLIQDWLSLGMICDPDSRIRDSVRRIGDYCWLQGPIQNGINRLLTDTLHAYEEGVNITPHQAQLYYGDPVYLERLMETSRAVRDFLTTVLPDGRRFFKANWYGATRIDDEHQRGTDITSNALLMHAPLYLAYYSRNPGAMKLLEEWAGAWASLQNDAYVKNGLKGPFPIVFDPRTGKVVKTVDKTISGYGYLDTMLGMFTMTGQDKYFTPARICLDNGLFSGATLGEFAALRGDAYKDKIVEAAKAINWTPLEPHMSDDPRQVLSYSAWAVSGDRT
ncbi:MAG TPA: LamG domain-containing protein, partial [Candidatus Brocadiia bacterium]|nr:LamG domain-containing protein [Candidatus Brocadiia bacterium]